MSDDIKIPQKNQSKNQRINDLKILRPEAYFIISEIMNGATPMLPGLNKPFPQTFRVLKDQSAAPLFLEELPDKIIQLSSLTAVTQAIVNYTCGLMIPALHFDYDSSKKCALYWACRTEAFAEAIAPVLEAGIDGHTYHRLPYKFADMPTPLFDELMSRTSNWYALMGWIGSLFHEQSDRQQYVWLYGDGQNGKGALARVLSRVFKAAASWEWVPSKEDKFWTYGLLGKRLVVFGDCNNWGYPASGQFKSLTGGDLIKVEKKKEMAFTADLSCKFMFLSNETPALNLSKADMRRVIFCEMKPISSEADPKYEARLALEAAGIVYKCITAYESMMETDGVIRAETGQIEDLAAQNEDWLEVFFDTNFEEGGTSDFVIPSQLQLAFGNSHEFKTNAAQKLFKKYLVERHGARYCQTRNGKKRERRYYNIKKRPIPSPAGQRWD